MRNKFRDEKRKRESEKLGFFTVDTNVQSNVKTKKRKRGAK